MIAFYYLLRVGEYKLKGTGHQDSGATQPQQFKMKDVAFFGTKSRGGAVQIIAKFSRFQDRECNMCNTQIG